MKKEYLFILAGTISMLSASNSMVSTLSDFPDDFASSQLEYVLSDLDYGGLISSNESQEDIPQNNNDKQV